jgi:flagellar hook protein FlgE
MAYLGTLNTATSALQSFSQGLNDVGNNIANVNTTAYKATTASYSDTFSGLGVQVTTNSTDYTQGSLVTTGVPTDLAISGNGYFLVQTVPSTPGGTAQLFATRDGKFTLDPNGYLVNSLGYQVMGNDPQNSGDNKPVRVVSPFTTGSSTLAVVSVAIDSNGYLQETLSDGNKVPTASIPQVLLCKFNSPQSLVGVGNNLFTNLGAGGPATGSTVLTHASNAPGANGLGTIQSGCVEASNVDLTTQFTNMIRLQRAFDANAHVVTVTDTLMQTITDLKRS